MDLIYGTAIAWAAPFFLIAVIGEVMVDRARGTRYYTLPDAITSISCGTAFIGARISFGFIGLLAYGYVLEHFAPVMLSAHQWTTWLFALVLYDFCYYWWHRLSHTVAFLWGSHVVHHQSTEFNLTTALRQPASAFLSGWVFYLPLALCGVPLSVYLTVGIAQLLYQFWPHTRHIGKLGALDRWVQTPSNHRVHHACNGRYLNKNYVGVFLIWDRLFGTFEEECADTPCVYGITDNVDPWNPVWANVHFFWSLAVDSWKTQYWRDKARLWFAAPGWRPSDLQHSRTHSGAPPRVSIPSMRAYAVVQFAVIIAANQHFLLTFHGQTFMSNALYFGLILAGLTTVSALLAGRSEFFVFEPVRLLLIGGATAATGTWLGNIHSAAIVTAVVLYAAASLVWFGMLWRAYSSGIAELPHGVRTDY